MALLERIGRQWVETESLIVGNLADNLYNLVTLMRQVEKQGVFSKVVRGLSPQRDEPEYSQHVLDLQWIALASGVYVAFGGQFAHNENNARMFDLVSSAKKEKQKNRLVKRIQRINENIRQGSVKHQYSFDLVVRACRVAVARAGISKSGETPELVGASRLLAIGDSPSEYLLSHFCAQMQCTRADQVSHRLLATEPLIVGREVHSLRSSGYTTQTFAFAEVSVLMALMPFLPDKIEELIQSDQLAYLSPRVREAAKAVRDHWKKNDARSQIDTEMVAETMNILISYCSIARLSRNQEILRDHENKLSDLLTTERYSERRARAVSLAGMLMSRTNAKEHRLAISQTIASIIMEELFLPKPDAMITFARTLDDMDDRYFEAETQFSTWCFSDLFFLLAEIDPTLECLALLVTALKDECEVAIKKNKPVWEARYIALSILKSSRLAHPSSQPILEILVNTLSTLPKST